MYVENINKSEGKTYFMYTKLNEIIKQRTTNLLITNKDYRL